MIDVGTHEDLLAWGAGEDEGGDAVAVSLGEGGKEEAAAVGAADGPEEISVDVEGGEAEDGASQESPEKRRASLRETLLSLGAPNWAVEGMLAPKGGEAMSTMRLLASGYSAKAVTVSTMSAHMCDYGEDL